MLTVAVVIGMLLASCSQEAGAPTPAPAEANPAPRPTATPTPTSAQANPAPQPTATPTAASAPGGDAREVEVVLDNNRFPAKLVFKVGEKVRIIVTNKGNVVHSFEFTDFDVLEKFEPGETRTFEWTVPNQPGEYDCGCFLTDPSPEEHEGMDGICIILEEQAQGDLVPARKTI